MNTERHNQSLGINNALMVSIIFSFIFHFALLQTDIKTVNIEQEISLPSAEEIKIPIEFIPAAQTVTAREYSVSDIESTQKLITEAENTETNVKQLTKRTGTYSLNRTKTALRQFLLSVREEIEKNKYISTPSNYSQLVGNVKISFAVSADGVFSNIRIVESSSNALLDQSALSAIKSASGKTKRPKNTGVNTIQASAVVKYQYGL